MICCKSLPRNRFLMRKPNVTVNLTIYYYMFSCECVILILARLLQKTKFNDHIKCIKKI